MKKITGDEPFYPVTRDNGPIKINTDNPRDYCFGITIRQEAILRFMVESAGRWHPELASKCADDAKVLADAYIKSLNDE